MLFNSYGFILFFLPVTFFVYFWVGSRRHMYGAAWLTAVTFSKWVVELAYVSLLLASILFNYGIGRLLARERPPAWLGRKALS